MAGLGRRTFAAGEVLTASNVMGYLQDQAVMAFAGTAARGSAIGSAVSEGMVSYLADSNSIEVYTGSYWNTVSQVTSPNYIINGGFDIWQRGTSYTGIGYSADRWFASFSSTSVSRSTDAPSGFTYSANVTRSTGTSNYVSQRIESANSRELVGKTVNISFWAKNAGVDETLEVSIYTADSVDNFSAMTIYGAPVIVASSAFSTSWTRYSATFNNLPSSAANGVHMQIVARTATSVPGHSFYLTGVQLEEGSVMTAFRRNANSIQGELAACQRYYFRTAVPGNGDDLCIGWVINSTTARVGLQFPVRMRTAPTALEQSNTASDYYVRTPASIVVCSAVPTWFTSTADFGSINLTVASGLTTGYGTTARAQNANAFFGWSAEL